MSETYFLSPGTDFGSPKASHVVIADAIRRRIALGGLSPGEKLPTERQLAEQLGVGRMSIRAAFRMLNEEGLVVTTKRGRTGGTRVATETRRRSKREIAQLTTRVRSDVADNYAFRTMVEPPVAAMAAKNASDDQRAHIVDAANAPIDSIADYRSADSRFHLAIAEACGNRHALDAVRRTRAEFFLWADALWDDVWDDHAQTIELSQAEHRRIAKAIAAGNEGRARSQMTKHLADGADNFQRVIGRARENGSEPAKG